MKTEHDLRLAAERGARFLDHHEPGWHLNIDPSVLDMSDPWLCIIGQLFDGYYVQGLTTLRVDAIQAHHFGFDFKRSYGAPSDEDWFVLGEHWRTEITNRLSV